MSNTLGSLSKTIFWINQIVLKMWLSTWTQIKLRIYNFWWVPLTSQNPSLWKTLGIMNYSDGKGAISIQFIKIILQS